MLVKGATFKVRAAVLACIHHATPLTYLWYAGLRVAVLLFCRLLLLVAGVTGHHVV